MYTAKIIGMMLFFGFLNVQAMNFDIQNLKMSLTRYDELSILFKKRPQPVALFFHAWKIQDECYHKDMPKELIEYILRYFDLNFAEQSLINHVTNSLLLLESPKQKELFDKLEKDADFENKVNAECVNLMKGEVCLREGESPHKVFRVLSNAPYRTISWNFFIKISKIIYNDSQKIIVMRAPNVQIRNLDIVYLLLEQWIWQKNLHPSKPIIKVHEVWGEHLVTITSSSGLHNPGTLAKSENDQIKATWKNFDKIFSSFITTKYLLQSIVNEQKNNQELVEIINKILTNPKPAAFYADEGMIALSDDEKERLFNALPYQEENVGKRKRSDSIDMQQPVKKKKKR